MTPTTLADLESGLADLDEDRAALAYTLRREAEALLDRGPQQLTSVAEAAETFAKRFAELEAGLRELSSDEVASPTQSTAQLRERLAEARSRHPVMQLLSTVSLLKGESASPSMESIRTAAGQLEAQVHQGVALAVNDLEHHPLACLIRLVSAGTELSDDQWDQDLQRVRDGLGPSTATAVARGRITLGTTTEANDTNEVLE